MLKSNNLMHKSLDLQADSKNLLDLASGLVRGAKTGNRPFNDRAVSLRLKRWLG
jgi:hypothetical protein